MFSVYERGDSVALAVQNRTVVFPAEEGDSRKHFSPELRDLVLKLLNLDINFRYLFDYFSNRGQRVTLRYIYTYMLV